MTTASHVAAALATYAESVAKMGASVTVRIPALEDDGTIAMHSLLLTGSTTLETFDIDDTLEHEDERLPLPAFPSVGGTAVAVDADEFPDISVPIRE